MLHPVPKRSLGILELADVKSAGTVPDRGEVEARNEASRRLVPSESVRLVELLSGGGDVPPGERPDSLLRLIWTRREAEENVIGLLAPMRFEDVGL